MTAIAAFQVADCPTLFGDLLITGEAEAAQPVTLPALGDVSDFFEGSGWAIRGLRQKLTLINNNCVIAWAGSWLGARVAISNLRNLARTEPLTLKSVQSCIVRTTELETHSTSLVGWIYEGGQQFGLLSHNATSIDGGKYNPVRLAGSGSPALDEFFQFGRSLPWKLTGEINPPEHAMATGLAMAGLLLRSEAHGSYGAPTLRTMFGGGYEVACFAGGRFQKIGDCTFVIWEALVSADGVQLSLPQLVMKQRYVGDVLLLHSARMSGTDPTGRILIDEQFHAVLPMFELQQPLVADQILADTSLDSSVLCHCIVVRAGTDTSIHTRIQRTGLSSERPMTFQRTSDGITVGISDAFLRDFAASIRAGG